MYGKKLYSCIAQVQDSGGLKMKRASAKIHTIIFEGAEKVLNSQMSR